MEMAGAMEQNKQEQSGEESTFKSTIKKGPELYHNAKRTVNDAYSKTARAASQAYEQTKTYSMNNPGKAILIALGVGMGLGFILGSNSRPSRLNRIGRPVVDALASMGREFFR